MGAKEEPSNEQASSFDFSWDSFPSPELMLRDLPILTPEFDVLLPSSEPLGSSGAIGPNGLEKTDPLKELELGKQYQIQNSLREFEAEIDSVLASYRSLEDQLHLIAAQQEELNDRIESSASFLERIEKNCYKTRLSLNRHSVAINWRAKHLTTRH